ncbi:MAG: carbonic anhydrase [Gammaproteobacteria bacterium]|jgi:carbonic anhydrase|nr:carbonic anhydrase [Gammaproteobacteria bacterium]MBU0772489.1 carbonic anhydrase [Gammaproteobacteria bacterium]MBU0855034.1 carbonic anhydrase [Gammaproteobacteria bacterium]MBU1847223.1 carbonic anhydrase [Gammaproteobacteria bacterium]
MPDELLDRLRRFHEHTFPGVQEQFQHLVREGQHPTILFIGCSDSRLVPYLLTGTGPGELFIVRNVGAFVPPCDCNGRAGNQLAGFHGTAAAIEYAVLNLAVAHIVVCGHSHCGGVRALYEGVTADAPNLNAWLDLGREATLPAAVSAAGEVRPDILRRTEQRAVVLQLERLMGYPMVRSRVDAGRLALHGWHYVIEDGEVHVFDMHSGAFVPASSASHSGTGPWLDPGAGISPMDAW